MTVPTPGSSGAALRSLYRTFLRGLYRTFLRGTNTAVLHKRSSAQHLKALWRPAFDDASRAIRTLDTMEASSPEYIRLRAWLSEWESRADGTLALLANATTSRGIPHRLLVNISTLRAMDRHWHMNNFHATKSKWNGQLPPSSPEYSPRVPTPATIRKEKQAAEDLAWDSEAWDAMSEVMELAAARDKVQFGRIVKRRFREFTPSGRALY